MWVVWFSGRGNPITIKDIIYKDKICDECPEQKKCPVDTKLERDYFNSQQKLDLCEQALELRAKIDEVNQQLKK